MMSELFYGAKAADVQMPLISKLLGRQALGKIMQDVKNVLMEEQDFRLRET